jgi:sulfur relay (sulfurtransferase) complex TusBCD TusD component (DsrE family)
MSEKLGILLTTSPESENTHTVIRLAETALAAGRQVEMFLMCDGVYHLNDPRLEELTKKGVKVAVCAQNCLERKVERKTFVLWGSQYDLATLIKESDRFLSFN